MSGLPALSSTRCEKALERHSIIIYAEKSRKKHKSES